jgi:hypothetical protein
MSDLTKASEALLASAVYIVNELDWKCVPLDGLAEKLLAIEAAVRSDTLADVAARLPDVGFALEQMDREHGHHHIPGTTACYGCGAVGRGLSAYRELLAHLTPDR